jgi:hypothetical protein
MKQCKVVALGDDPADAVLHVEHDDEEGVIKIRVPFAAWRNAEVGGTVAVPDDLSSPMSSALGYFKLDF